MKKNRLFERNFTLVVIGQIISLFGATILKFALSLYVLDLTGRADIFATILAVSTIPIIMLSPIGGAIADRFNRKNLMVIFDFLNCSIVLFFIIWLQSSSATVTLIGLIMTLLSIISTIYQPTVQASIPLLVKDENLLRANGVVSGVAALTGIAGPILGGVLYSFVGLNAIVIVSCISFFLSAVMEIFIQIPFTKRKQVENVIVSIIKDMKDGIIFITKEKTDILKLMILAAGLNLFLVPLFLVGIPYIIKITMNGSDVLFGIAQGAISFSSILGAIGVSIVGQKIKIEKLHFWLILIGVLMIAMAASVFTPILKLGFWISFILFTTSAILIFITTTIISIFCVTMVQKETPNDILGKVMAILFAVSTCVTPIGQILYGALLDGFSAAIYIPILIACVIIFLMAFLSKIMLKPIV